MSYTAATSLLYDAGPHSQLSLKRLECHSAK